MCRGPLNPVQPADFIVVEEVWTDPLYCDELSTFADWLLQTPGDAPAFLPVPHGASCLPAPAVLLPYAAPLPALTLSQCPTQPSPFDGSSGNVWPVVTPCSTTCPAGPRSSAPACTTTAPSTPALSSRGAADDAVVSWLSGWARLATSEPSTRCGSPCKPTGTSAASQPAGVGGPFGASASLEASSSPQGTRIGNSSGSPGTSLQRTRVRLSTKHAGASKRAGVTKHKRRQQSAAAAARDAPAWARNLVNAVHEAALAVRCERADSAAPAQPTLESLSHRRQQLEAELAKATLCLAQLYG